MFQSCAEEITQTAESSWLSGSEKFERRSLLVSWEPAGALGLPSEALAALPELTITRAWLRMTPLDTWNADALNLVGDWRTGVCTESDDTLPNGANALSTAGLCGTQCQFDGIVPNEQVDLPLDIGDADAHRQDLMSLRLQVDGAPASGRNGVQIADGSGEDPGPKFVMEACAPPATPTPEPGCHIDTFTPDANGWTIVCSQKLRPRMPE